jgi:hypothetical protein
MPATDSPSRSSSPYVVEQVAVSLHRSALGAVWRWRSETAILAGTASTFFECWHCIGLDPTGFALGVPAALAAALPWSRRWLLAQAWKMFVRHRLQRTFWELRLHTRAGRLPLIPFIFATPVGCRALVMLRAGMTFDDFEDSADAFATACGARDCHVTASPRFAWFVWIDIIRRDALGPSRVVRSPLADFPDVGGYVPGYVVGDDLPDSELPSPPAWPGPALAED